MPVAPHEYEVIRSEEVFTGRVISLRQDTVAMPGGGDSVREVVRHPGAVAVVALHDDDSVVLVRQYRHPVGAHLWELPAGLRDVAGEDEALTAARELAEETDLTAGRIEPLIDLYTSPGFADEFVRVFLARDLAPVPEADRHVRTAEEADLEVRRVDLDEAVAMVFRGEITNAATVGGVLAAARARDTGWSVLRAS